MCALKAVVREILQNALESLGNYCESVAAGDVEKLIASGFDLAKVPSPVGQLDPVEGLTGKYTGINGVVDLKWKGRYGAKSFLVQARTGNDPFTQIGVTTRARFTAQGLTFGMWDFRVIAVGTAGESAPSAVASVLVG